MARYVVVRYYPAADKGECVNAGVIAYSDDRVMAEFVTDWGRVQRFGQQDITFLREFARDLTRRTSPDANASEKLTAERIEQIAGSWGHSIQFSRPAGSTLDVPLLLKDMVEQFLPGAKAPTQKPRNRMAAMRVVRHALRDAFVARGIHRPSDYVKQRFEIQGAVKRHQFDFAIANGEIKDGIFAFSFANGVNARLMTEIEAAAFALEDVRERHPNLHLSAMVLESEHDSEEAAIACDVLRKKRAEIVSEEKADEWATEVSSRYVHV